MRRLLRVNEGASLVYRDFGPQQVIKVLKRAGPCPQGPGRKNLVGTYTDTI